MSATAAVIDIGSNSIKVLVAQRAASGRLISLKMRTIDARISAGLSGVDPRLTEEGMARGLAAITELLDDAAVFSPSEVALVATSAVRGAANGEEFRERVKQATGHLIEILSGSTEANTIGRGLTCDPSLGELSDFYLFDLGGGSLECLSFRERVIRQALSLPLGCVRLTESCVPNATLPFGVVEEQRVVETTRRIVGSSEFSFDLGPGAVAIGTGGTLTTARALLAVRQAQKFEASDPVLTVAQLRELLTELGGYSLEARRGLPGVPAARADVLPAALATLITVAELGGLTAYRHSLYNLRWGVADQLLPARPLASG